MRSSVMSDYKERSEKAAKYLRWLRPKGYVNLVSICPNESRKPIGITRDSKSPDLLQFIEENNGVCNLYYMVNEPYENSPNNKLTKSNVKNINALFIDIDPDKQKDFEEERKRIIKFSEELKNDPSFAPNVIIDSGGGYQAFWFLKDPISAEDAENYGRGLAKKYKTDSVQNIDRIMRLPHTLNIPGKSKIGRPKGLSKITHINENFYYWDDLKNICEPVKSAEYKKIENIDFKGKNLTENLKWEDEPELKNRFDNLLRQDSKLQDLMSKKIEKPSRSEYDFALAGCLKEYGWTLEETAIAMWLFPHGKGKELTDREIIRTYERFENHLADLKLSENDLKRIEESKNPLLSINSKLEIRKRKYKSAGEMSWQKSSLPLFKGLIDQGTVVAIYGQSNVGKSFVVADIAAHVAAGKDWDGYKLRAKGSVLIVAAEAGATYGKRVEAIKRRMNKSSNVTLTEFPFAVYDEHINLLETENGKCQGVENLIIEAQLLAQDSGHLCKLIVIDTLSAVFGAGNENSPDDMGAMMDHLLMLAKRTGATIIIIHHSGKDQNAGLRGHTKLIAGIDTSLEIKAQKVGARYKREIHSKKQRDNDECDPIEFNLNVIELGKDEDGDPITSCNILLKNDNEFGSVMPDKLSNLTEGQLIAYKTVFISHYTQNFDKKQMYGWYFFISKNPHTELEKLKKVADSNNHPEPISSNSDLVKKNTVGDQWNKLKGKGLIDKNTDGHWVLTNE